MAHTTTSTTNFIRRPNLDFKKNLRRICKTRKNTKVHSSTATQGITTLRAKDSSSFFSFLTSAAPIFYIVIKIKSPLLQVVVLVTKSQSKRV